MKITRSNTFYLNNKFCQKIVCHSLFFLLFLSGFTALAQESVLLKGKVEANNPDVEKIHIINLNLEKGAVTDANGKFQIFARENDSLYISSVQFQNTTIVVSRRMIEDQSLVVRLQDKMNELAEVIIDDIQLSGHLANDLSKISISDIENKYQLQNKLNDFIRKDREMNPYVDPISASGIRIDKIAGAVIEKLAGDRDEVKIYTPRELANKSIAIVGHEFFREDLALKENEICNFVYYCAEDANFKRLVINNNAFVLIEYFQTKIGDFRERRGSSLNAIKEIPG